MTRAKTDLGKWAPHRIRKFREDQGWSDVRLAAEVGVSVDAVRNWESGKNEPGASNLIGLVRALACRLEDLTE